MIHSLLLFAADAPPLSLEMRLPLSVMNFLEFAVWGAWFVVMGQYLHHLKFTGKQIGSIYSTMALGSIFSPILVGAVADKYFSGEVVMAVSHLIGAGLLFWMATIRTPGRFYLAALLYALVYSPTIAVSGAITFAHVPDGARDFPTLRVLGTIGWIAANLFLKVLLKPNEPVNNRPFVLAAVLSLGLGIYSFFLPHTAPKGEGNPFPFLDALALLKEPSFAIFFGISFLITIALAFYYGFTSLFLEQRVGVRPGNVGPLMTIGQWMEIFFLAGIPWWANGGLTMEFGLPWFLKNFGMKNVLLIGMAAWGVRYAIFSAGRPFGLVLLGLALHGICYDFFFAAGQIHVDNTANESIRNSAQSLFIMLTYGIGMYLGNVASGWVNSAFSQEAIDPVTGQKASVTNWTKFWLVPCIGVVICFAMFVLLFNSSK